MKKRLITLLFAFIIMPIVFANGQSGKPHLKMATTTSTENSGLLDELIPQFEKETGIKVDIIAVGTGKAITLGENGDVDLILVHVRSRENEFIIEGHGINRKDVMFNDFVILGPADDPAGIKGLSNASEAFEIIRAFKVDFLSRGDDSGTHTKERFLWSINGFVPTESWYKETGQSMGTVLTMTSEIGGYTITDRGTYLAMKDILELEILVEGDPELFNPYGIIAVNPERYKDSNFEDAMTFIDFITSNEGQAIINNFKKNSEQLFFGNARQ